jgi:hypothetical protein
MARLQYEFRHLALNTSVGYDPTYYLQSQIEKEDDTEFTFELDAEDEIQKGISTSIVIFGSAYLYVKNWLIDHPNASVHTILVRITDTLAGVQLGEWLLKADSLQWCDDDICRLKITLREYWPELDCLKSTLISDNHRGWFPDNGFIPANDLLTGTPLNQYMHPRIQYCDDIRPQALQNFLFVIAQSILIAFNTAVGPLIWMLQFANSVANTLGLPSPPLYSQIMSLINDIYDATFGAFLGCLRVHPSPFVRNYFINACSKCGIDFESSILNDPASRYYKLVHMFAPVKKGIKRSSSQDWIPDNKPIYNVWLYAKSLKKIFNAKYILRSNKFIFERKDAFGAQIYDFDGADKSKLLDKTCYQWDGEPKPAYEDFKYGVDALDNSGNMAAHRFNDITEFNPGGTNPLLQGHREIYVEGYAPQRYTTDGIEEREVFNQLGLQFSFLDHHMLLAGDVTQLGKLIVFDDLLSTDQYAEPVRVDVSGWKTTTNVDFSDDYAWTNNDNGYYIYNMPMMYDKVAHPDYPNLYEFHQIDDPNLSSKKNIEWQNSIALCTDDLVLCLFENPGDVVINAKLDYTVKLNAQFDGSIRKIVIDYKNNIIRLFGRVK